ncbi:MAG: alpha/beta hydrolase [Gemmatimonadales bacterium]
MGDSSPPTRRPDDRGSVEPRGADRPGAPPLRGGACGRLVQPSSSEYRRGGRAAPVEYSLAPEHCFPKPVDETVAVIDWVRNHGCDFGLDRIVFAGDSAGAHIALVASTTLRDRSLPPAQGMVLNYGEIDDDFDRPSRTESG